MWPRNEARMDNNLFQLFTSCPSEVKADAAMFEDTKLYCVKQNMRKENGLAETRKLSHASGVLTSVG